MIYECPEHGREDFTNPSCETCGRIRRLIEANQKASAQRGKRSRLRMEIYWPSRMGHEGRLIENLEHRPRFFSNKDKFRDYLKRNRIQEAG